MAVGADIGADIEVVEQHEVIGDLVMIGRDVLAEEHQRRVAIALLDIAENLVVGAVFLHDVDDVLDGRGIGGTRGHGIASRNGNARPSANRDRASWRSTVSV